MKKIFSLMTSGLVRGLGLASIPEFPARNQPIFAVGIGNLVVVRK